MNAKYGKKILAGSMHKFKRGKSQMGRTEKKVKDPKQAVAIGLSRARKSGAKVPQKKG